VQVGALAEEAMAVLWSFAQAIVMGPLALAEVVT